MSKGILDNSQLCKICSKRLGNRNKYGYCKEHKHLSQDFILKKKKMKRIARLKRISNYSIEEKQQKLSKQRMNLKKFRESKRSKERNDFLNHVNSLSEMERLLFFKNKRYLYNRQYEQKRIKDDLSFKLSKRIRSRVSKVVSKNIRLGSAIKDLGCSLEELKAYLESKFLPGMSWSNYGHKGWHIDHIKPLCSFDLTNPEQFKKACHYTNLQPLWWYENLSKISKDKEIKYGQK